MTPGNSDSHMPGQTRNRLAEMVATCVDWVRNRQALVVLTRPPLHLPPGVEVTMVPGEPLSEASRRTSSSFLHVWPEAAVNSLRYHMMVAVIDGEADFRIGVTESMQRENPAIPGDCMVNILQVPRSSILLIPPGVPYADGELMPHWERSPIANAKSSFLWCYFVNHGIFLYSCTTRGARHTHSRHIFISNPWVLPIVEILTDSMSRNQGQLGNVEHSLLLAMLQSIDRACNLRQYKLVEDREAHDEFERYANTASTDNQTIQRARQYIEMHLTEAMVVEQIAAHAFVSVSQLKHLFRTRLQTSVMRYVAQQRIALAETLLLETDLSISEISQSIGYSRANYFARAFYKETGQQPREYRSAGRARQPGA